MGKTVGNEVGSVSKRFGKKVYKGVFKKKYTIADMAMKAWNGVKYMKELINSERKLYTKNITVANTDYSGTVYHLSDMTQGDTTSQREGRSVLLNYISIRGNLARVTGDSIIRVVVFQDTQQQGYTPSADQLLQTVGTSLAPFAPLDTSFAGRFKILCSDLVSLNSQNPNVVYKKYIKKLSHIKWQTTADGGGAMKGHIYMLLISDQAAASSDKPNFQFVVRLGFRDN